MQRKTEILEELEEIEVFLRMYRKFSGDVVEDLIDDNIDQNVGIPQREFPNVARHFLLEARRPLTSRQLMNTLKENGIPIGGADELRNLTTKLWRARDEIMKLEGGFYWPRGVNLP